LSLSPEEKDTIVSYCDASDQKDGFIDYKEFFTTFYSHETEKLEKEKGTLRQIFVLTRHGCRFPLNPTPGDSNWPRNEDFWKTYNGKLTTRGIVQHMNLGKHVKEAYFSEMGITDDDFAFPEKITAYSTNTDRTFLSASGFLEGLAPLVPYCFGVQGEEYHQRKNFQGIRVTLLSDDSIMHGYKHKGFDVFKQKCINENAHFKELVENQEKKEFIARLHDITQLERLGPNQSLTNYADAIDNINSQIEIERCLHLPILSNAKGLLVSKDDEKLIRVYTEQYFRSWFQGNNDKENLELGKIGAGTLPARIIQQFKERISSENTGPKKNIFFYSGHDTTIYSLLTQFGFKDWENTFFAACVILELHELKDGYHVAIKYNSNTTEHPNLKTLRTYKMPVGKGSVKMSEAQEGMHTLEEFENFLMNERHSFKTSDEWRNHIMAEE
jgi:hypothetical protein